MNIDVASVTNIVTKVLSGPQYKCLLARFASWKMAAQLANAIAVDIARTNFHNAGDATADLIVIESVGCKLAGTQVTALRGEIYKLFGNKAKAQKYGIYYPAPPKVPTKTTPKPESEPTKPSPPVVSPKPADNTMLYVAIGAVLLFLAAKR